MSEKGEVFPASRIFLDVKVDKIDTNKSGTIEASFASEIEGSPETLVFLMVQHFADSPDEFMIFKELFKAVDKVLSDPELVSKIKE